MEKKLGEINESFQHQRFNDCLVIIEQTLKKFSKGDKKKQALTPEQIKIMKCFKAGSLASLGRQHEANAVFEEVMDVESIASIGNDYSLMLTAISELFGEGRELKTIQLLDKHAPKHIKESLYRFYLNCHMFSELGKLFLKQYAKQKKSMMQLGQIYLQYLQCLEKVNMIEYKRDGWYHYDEQLKGGLKMVIMFLDRCIKNNQLNLQSSRKDAKEKEGKILPQDQEHLSKLIHSYEKLTIKGKELKLKIAINEGRVQDAINLFDQIRKTLNSPFTFIRSIIKLGDKSEDKKIVNTFYIQEMSRIFRTNLDFNNYTPLYDYYNEFLVYVTSRVKSDNINGEKIQLQEGILPAEELYLFNSFEWKRILEIYYCSLFSEYESLVDNNHPQYEVRKKWDYYKICIKGLLLQLIQISQQFGTIVNFTKYLNEYTKYFAGTLTYGQELRKYWKLLLCENILVRRTQVESQSQLIELINFYRISIGDAKEKISYDGFMSIFKELGELYSVMVKQIQKSRKLQKGQRYLSDEFYTIISDYARAYIQHDPSSQNCAKVIALMINELQYVVQVSPYNADTKLRLMHFCKLVNHYERLIEIYLSNDIKSVQMETLGYWFLRVGIEFGLDEQHYEFVQKCVKSYQENQRETSEYGLKALKAGELQRVDEFLCYRDCMLKSYNSVVLLYLLYQRYRFQVNSDFYLVKINQKLKIFGEGKQLTFNADFKVMDNFLFEEFGFGDVYGLFNNWQILQSQVNLYLHEQILIYGLVEKNSQKLRANVIGLPNLEERIRKFDAKALFDFSQYQFRQGDITFKLQSSKNTVASNLSYLETFKDVSIVRVVVIMLAQQLLGFIRTKSLAEQRIGKQRVLQSIHSLRQRFGKMNYRCQIHAITTIRRGLLQSYNLLNVIREVVLSNKKLKFASELIKDETTKPCEQLLDVITNLRWSNRPSSSKMIQSRDQLIERQMSLDPNQLKRLLSRYQILYKI